MQEIVHVIPVKSPENIFKFPNIEHLFLILKNLRKERYFSKIFIEIFLKIFYSNRYCNN